MVITQVPFLFGWAKPVPVNPYRFRRLVSGDIIVSVAGVTVNFLLAILFAALLHIAKRESLLYPALELASGVNILLAIFNLLPIPPLDGSHLFKYLLKPTDREAYEALGFYGLFLIMIVLMVFGGYIGAAVMFVRDNVVFKIALVS